MKLSRYEELRKLSNLVNAWLTEEKMSVSISNVIHALEALGYLSSRPTKRAADVSLGWEIPEGYDAICNFCHYPFVFNQAKGSGAKEWKKYCCLSCENGTAVLRSRR